MNQLSIAGELDFNYTLLRYMLDFFNERIAKALDVSADSLVRIVDHTHDINYIQLRFVGTSRYKDMLKCIKGINKECGIHSTVVFSENEEKTTVLFPTCELVDFWNNYIRKKSLMKFFGKHHIWTRKIKTINDLRDRMTLIAPHFYYRSTTLITQEERSLLTLLKRFLEKKYNNYFELSAPIIHTFFGKNNEIFSVYVHFSDLYVTQALMDSVQRELNARYELKVCDQYGVNGFPVIQYDITLDEIRNALTIYKLEEGVYDDIQCCV